MTTECGSPPRAGGDLRTHRLLEGLCKVADVDVVVVRGTDAPALRAATGALTVVNGPPQGGRLRVRVRALWRGWPVTSARAWDRALARRVEVEAERGTVIVLEHIYLDVLRPPRGAYVISTQNVERPLLASLPKPPSRLRRVQHAWEVAMVGRLEKAVRRRARARVVAVSTADAAAFGPRAVAIENGTDLPAAPGPRPEHGLLLFVGSMTYQPNVEAVRWWCEHIAPVIRPDLPPLTVVGRRGVEALADLEGIDVRGEVDDLSTFLRQARVVVVPLQHGAGTRLKVLEALAWERPVVSTGKGVEGLPVTSGEHLLVTDDPEGFAGAVETLWDDDALAQSLTSAGRELVRCYDWEGLGRRFAEVVLQRP